MAKKKPATKKTAKRTSKKAAGSTTAKKAASKKKTTKSAAAKPAATKKATPSKKAAPKKPTAKKTTTKKAGNKKAPSKKATPAGTRSAEPAPKKTTKKASAAEANVSTPDAADAPLNSAPDSEAESQADGKSARKGITIVENRSRKKKVESKFQPPPSTLGSLLAKRKRQPLIPSGPNAPVSEFSTFGHDGTAKPAGKKVKSPFKKKELDSFRAVLLAKRSELAGDVQEMERGMASLGDRGGNPALDVAEQGSDAYDQSLSIGLAEADRKLIREIDDALRRIDEGVYGICEVTLEPISPQRLNELPWTRLSIEAARDAERRGGGR